MNKVININLGGQAYTVDDIAYDHLESYLRSVRQSFRHLEGCDEILADIESRMSELLATQLGSRRIVTTGDINAIIGIMGRPDQFDPEAERENAGSATGKKSGDFTFRPGKKLYRDPENKIIGGVCSGLSAYFGIADPVWVRLAFVLLLTAGVGGMLYLILLVIVPKAETAADRLAMHGEPVNIQSIADAVEKQFQEISDKLSELGQDLSRRKK